jgi:hypothetical protein
LCFGAREREAKKVREREGKKTAKKLKRRAQKKKEQLSAFLSFGGDVFLYVCMYVHGIYSI